MQPSQRLPKGLIWILLALALIGFSDAAYLSAKHIQGEAPTCVLFSGCELVTTSKFATIAGVPVAFLGALFYLAALALIIWFLDSKNARAIRLLALLSVPGFIFTLYLVGLQAFVLDAWCIYCVASAISSTTIFVLAQFARRALNRNKETTLTS